MCILSEDTYGVDFLRGVVDRLVKEGFVSPVQLVEGGHSNGMAGNVCNTKVNRILRAAIPEGTCDRVVVAIDADGHDPAAKEQEFIEKHVPTELRGSVCVLAFEQEAEEWITVSMGKGVAPGGLKPSEYLRQHERYEKRKLPEYADELNLDSLRELRSFRKFLECLERGRRRSF